MLVSLASFASAEELMAEVSSRPGWQRLARAAARYDSPACRDAIHRLPKAWSTIGIPSGPQARTNRDRRPIDLALSAMVSVIENPCHKGRIPVALFVENFKAGSTFTGKCVFPNSADKIQSCKAKANASDASVLSRRFGGHGLLPYIPSTGGSAYMAGKLSSIAAGERRWRRRAPALVNSTLTLTVARDPIATAISAYMQVSTTRDGMGDDVKHGEIHRWSHYSAPKYRNISCQTEESRIRRYNAFLDAIEAGQPLGTEAFHVLPQANKIDVINSSWRSNGRTRYDVIGHLEELQVFAHELAKLTCGTDHRTGLADEQIAMPARHKSRAELNSYGRTPEAERKQNCAFDIYANEDLLRRVCRMYAVDYACFEYRAPRECAAVLSPTLTSELL
ncbi:MAG: hypothetical protein SGPRY_006835 [Prymnesium sp.]